MWRKKVWLFNSKIIKNKYLFENDFLVKIYDE